MKLIYLNKIFRIAILTLIIISNLMAGDDADKILRNIQKKYESWNDATISFTQQVLFAVTKSEQTFDGKLIVKKGNKYRIDLEQQLIITDGKTLWNVNKTNKQVMIDNYRDDPKSITPEKMLTNIPKNYNATLLNRDEEGGADIAVLKLLPKEERSSFRSIKMWVDEDKSVLKKIQIIDASKNTITYTINNLFINSGLKENSFSYQPPDGYEVIDLR
ncbi:MAG: outer membrane lipoprotein chaperone LolA [Ignavibacteriales bacterium]|nr:outer membrane lipoprotein chaperone LolA [Ignavibacteriales bacterium]